MRVTAVSKKGIRSFAIVAVAALATHTARADYLAMNGAELYSRFCASCHGVAGRGDGPVSKSFKTEVPDLTLIARRQGGKFPAERIERIIDGRFTLLSHGTRDMPVWGAELARTEIGNPDGERATDLMIKRLLQHVQSLQRPATKDIEGK
jgi:mono/diheme cytochrome c family protein